MRGRSWDWAPRAEQRTLLAALEARLVAARTGEHQTEIDRKIHVRIDIHLLIAGPWAKEEKQPAARQGPGPPHVVPRKPFCSNLTPL